MAKKDKTELIRNDELQNELENFDDDDFAGIDLEDARPLTKDDIESENDTFDLGEDDMIGDFYGDEPTTIEKHRELLQSLTNFDNYLKEKFFAWSGLYWDAKEGKFKRDEYTQPIMNAQGAKWCISFLHTYVRNNNIITVLDEKTYRFILLDVVTTTGKMIADHYEDFNITNSADQRRLLDEMENSAQLILCGTAGGRYNELLSKTTLRQEHVSFGDGSAAFAPQTIKRVGLINRLKRMLGGNER